MIKFRQPIRLILLLIFYLSFASGLDAQKTGKKDKNNQEALTTAKQQEITNLFLDATKAKLTGNIEKAIDLYNSCLQKNPEHSASMFELAAIYMNMNDVINAERLCKKAAELEPENKWYKQLLADIYGQMGNKEELLKICKQLLEKEPDNAEYLYQLAQVYNLDNDASNAIKTYNKIEELIGVNEEISLQKQQIFLYQKKITDAVKEVEKLANEFPEQQSRYYSMIAEIFMKNNNPEKAAEYYKKIVESDPDNPYVHISLSDYYHQKGDEKQALSELEKGFSNPKLDVESKLRILFTYYNPANTDTATRRKIDRLAEILVEAHPGSAQAISFSAMLKYDENKNIEARTLFRKALSIDSSSYTVWENLLNIEIQLNNFDALMSESERASELFPLQPVPYFFSGAACFEKKKYQEAIDKFTKGVKFVVSNNPLLVQFYTYLGDAYNAVKNYRLSDESYEKALKLDPENSYVLNNYAYYLSLRNENLSKAEEMALKATQLKPDNAANLDTYGWVLYKSGKYENARKWVEKAVALSSEPDADLLEHLGDIYFKTGNVEKALENWKAAKNAGSESQELDKKIAEKRLHE